MQSRSSKTKFLCRYDQFYNDEELPKLIRTYDDIYIKVNNIYIYYTIFCFAIKIAMEYNIIDIAGASTAASYASKIIEIFTVHDCLLLTVDIMRLFDIQ